MAKQRTGRYGTEYLDALMILTTEGRTPLRNSQLEQRF